MIDEAELTMRDVLLCLKRSEAFHQRSAEAKQTAAA